MSSSLTDSCLFFLKLAEVFSRDGLSFLATSQNLVPKPWVIDDLDSFQSNWFKNHWKKVTPLFCCFIDTSEIETA